MSKSDHVNLSRTSYAQLIATIGRQTSPLRVEDLAEVVAPAGKDVGSFHRSLLRQVHQYQEALRSGSSGIQERVELLDDYADRFLAVGDDVAAALPSNHRSADKVREAAGDPAELAKLVPRSSYVAGR